MGSLVISVSSLQSLSEDRSRGNTSNSLYQATEAIIFLIPTPDKRHENKTTDQYLYEYRCKYPLKGISKSEVTMYKKDIYHDQVELFQGLIN